MVAMTTKVTPELHVGCGTEIGPLTVFPVWAGGAGPDGLVMGLAAKLRVAEREGHPVVGQLVVTNDGPRSALLVEGELLEGGWQHRMVEHDVVIKPHTSVVVQVDCVEAGRWNGATAHVRRARRASAGLRATLATSAPADRQQAVWAEVADLDVALGDSPTGSFLHHLDGALDARLKPAEAVGMRRKIGALRPLDGQRGVVVGVSGQPVLLELYPSSAALSAALPDLLNGLLVDAVADGAPPVPTPGRRARRLGRSVSRRRIRLADDIDAGAGRCYGADTEHASVRGIAVADAWAHLTVFNRDHELLEV